MDYFDHSTAESLYLSKIKDKCLEKDLRKHLQKQYKSKDKQFDALILDYLELFNGNKKLQNQFNEQGILAESISNNFTDLEQKLNTKIDENLDLIQKLEESAKRRVELLENNKRVQGELENVYADRKDLITTIDNLSGQLSEKKQLLAVKNDSQNDSLQKKVAGMQHEKHELFLKIDDLESQLKSFHKQREISEKQNEENSKKCKSSFDIDLNDRESLQSQSDHGDNSNDFNELEENLKSKIDENLKLLQELECSFEKGKQLMEENEQMRSEMGNVYKDKKDLLDIVENLANQVNESKNIFKNVNTKNSTHQSVNTTAVQDSLNETNKKQLYLKIDELEKEKNSFQIEMYQNEEELAKLRKELSQLKKDNNLKIKDENSENQIMKSPEKQREERARDEEITNLKISLNHSYNKKYELLLTNNGILSRKLNAKNEEIHRLEEFVSSVKKDVAGFVDEIDERTNKIRNLTMRSNPMLENRLRSDLLRTVSKRMLCINDFVSKGKPQHSSEGK